MLRPLARPFAAVATAAALAFAAPVASAWDDPVPITSPGGQASATGVAVGMDATGHATAIYAYTADVTDPHFGLVSVNHTVGHATLGGDIWDGAAPVSITDGVIGQTDSNGVPRLAIAVGAGGNAMAVWTAESQQKLYAASRPAVGQPFATPVPLTVNPSSPGGVSCPDNTNNPSPPTVAVNPQGSGHVAWIGTCVGQSSTVPIITRAFTAAGLAPTAFTTETANPGTEGGNAFPPTLAESPRGDEGATAYSHNLNGAGGGVVEDTFTTTPGDQRRTGQRYLSHASAGALPTQVRVAYLPDGRRIVAWKESAGTLSVSIGGATTTTIPTPGQSLFGLTLAAGADGTAVVGWLDGNGGALWAAVRSPDGTVGAPNPGGFGPAHQLSDTDGAPNHLRMAVAANGVGYAIWSRDTGAIRGIEGAILDPKDPARSPGTPWQFQPVPDTIIDGGFQSGIPAGSAQAPALAVDAVGNAEVLAPVQVVGGFTRYAIAAAESTSPRPPVVDTPAPGTPAAPAAPPAPATPAAATPTTPAPALPKPAPLKISAFQLTRDYFGVGSKEGKRLSDPEAETLTGRHPALGLRAGTKLNFTLSEAAKVTFTVDSGGCFDDKPATRAPAGEACTKKTKAGVEYYKKTVSAKKGRNSITFLGTNLPKHRHLLAGGQYLVQLAAKDPNTGKTVRPSRDYYARIDGAL